MDWFKFYGGQWLTDLKIGSISSVDRLCFITCLCVTNVTDESDGRTGRIVTYDEQQIIRLTRLSGEEEKIAVGFTERLLKLGLLVRTEDGDIVVKNYEKRQNSNLSGAERSKRYRDGRKVTNVTQKSDERDARVDKSRVDKNREREGTYTFLKNVPDDDVNELSEKYKISPKGIMSKAYDLLLYCQQKGRVYKNYRAFLENAIRKDKNALQEKYPVLEQKTHQEPVLPLTEAQQKRNEELKASIRAIAHKKTVQ